MSAPFCFHVYDLSQGVARTYSPLVLPPNPDGTRHSGVAAILHSAVVAFGYEYYFEGSVARRPAGRTRFGSEYAEVQNKHYVTTRSREAFESWIKETDWCEDDETANAADHGFGLLDYRAITHNCHAFCEAAARFLTNGLRGAPATITCNIQQLTNFPAGALAAHVMERLAGGVVHEMLKNAERAIGCAEVAAANLHAAKEASGVPCIPPAAIFVPRPWRGTTAATRCTSPASPDASGPLGAEDAVWSVLRLFVRGVLVDVHLAAAASEPPLSRATRTARGGYSSATRIDAAEAAVRASVRDVVDAPMAADVPANVAAILVDAITVALHSLGDDDDDEEGGVRRGADGAELSDAGDSAAAEPTTSAMTLQSTRSPPKRRDSSHSRSRAAAATTEESQLGLDETFDPFEDQVVSHSSFAMVDEEDARGHLDHLRRIVTRRPGSVIDGPAAAEAARQTERHDMKYLVGVLRAWSTLQLNPHIAAAVAQHAGLLEQLEGLIAPEMAGLWPPDVLAAILDLCCAMCAQHVSGSFLRHRLAAQLVHLLALGLFARDWGIIDRAASLYNNMVLLYRSYTLSAIELEMHRHGTAVPLGRATFIVLGALRIVFPPAAMMIEHPRLFCRPNPLSAEVQIAEARDPQGPLLTPQQCTHLIAREQLALQKLLLGLVFFTAEGEEPATVVAESAFKLSVERLGDQCLTEETHALRRVLARLAFPPPPAEEGGHHRGGSTLSNSTET